MEPQTPIDVQRILDRNRKGAEYDKQRKLKRKTDSESLTAIDEEYVLEKKRKKVEYARQYRLRQKLEKKQRASNATPKGDGSDSLKRKLELEMQTAIDEEYVLCNSYYVTVITL
jgi:hypothetical protein